MSEYDADEAEDWESYEETLFGLNSSQLSGIINILFWMIGAGLILWIGLAVFGPKPKSASSYESGVESFKDYKARAQANEEDDDEWGRREPGQSKGS